MKKPYVNSLSPSAAVGIALLLSGVCDASTYNCLPDNVQETRTRFEVLCSEPSQWEGGYPKDGNDSITTFAVPASDVDFAKRFLNVVQTAITAGMVVQFQYTSGDTSGASFGCRADRCRKPWGVGLLAAATDVRIPFAVLPTGAAQSIAPGEWMHYGPFSIGWLRKLVVTMTGTGNADLYVRRGSPPTETSDFACRPLLGTSNESCTIPGPAQNSPVKGETYFVGVRGAGASNTYTLSVSIENK